MTAFFITLYILGVATMLLAIMLDFFANYSTSFEQFIKVYIAAVVLSILWPITIIGTFVICVILYIQEKIEQRKHGSNR